MAEEQVEKRERKEREVLNDFGGTGDGNKSFFHKFGGFEKGDNAATKVIKDLQGLDAFKDGWQKACEGGSKLPVMEEMNGLFYLFGYFIKYLYQEGVPEWKEDETYFKDSIVKHGGFLFKAVYAETVTETIDGEDVKTAVGFSGIDKKPSEEGETAYWKELDFNLLKAANAVIAGKLTAGSATINGVLSAQSVNIDGALTANSLNATTDLTVGNDITATNEISTKDLVAENITTDSATITGTTDGSNSLDVTGKTNMTGDLALTGNANLGSLDVKGYTNINGELTAKGKVNLGDTSNNIFLKGKVYMANGGYPCIDIDNSSTNNMDKGVWIGKIKPTRSSATETIIPGYLSVDDKGYVSTSTITEYIDMLQPGVVGWSIVYWNGRMINFPQPDGSRIRMHAISCKMKRTGESFSLTSTPVLLFNGIGVLNTDKMVVGCGYVHQDGRYVIGVQVAPTNNVSIFGGYDPFTISTDTYLDFNLSWITPS